MQMYYFITQILATWLDFIDFFFLFTEEQFLSSLAVVYLMAKASELVLKT